MQLLVQFGEWMQMEVSMPQILLEMSDNVLEKNNLNSLFQQCHTVLSEILPTSIESCKSRAIIHNIYSIGNGSPNNAFVHINLKIMAGRSYDTQNAAGLEIMDILKKHFANSLKTLNLQITLEIDELQKTYYKITSDH